MIVVTGASRGLGQAICRRLINRGESVFGLARNVSTIDFQSAACDVSNPDDIKNVVRELKRLEPVTALINAAGIASMNLALTTPAGVTRKIIETNLLGTIYCCQSIAPLLVRQKKGSIVNFSTIAVPLGLKGESVYVASKAGVEGFTRSFAREMADFNIAVNCVAPGPIDTDLLRGVSPNQISKIVAQQIIGRQFTPDDVCDLVEVLLDPKARHLSGQVLNVGGV